LAASSLLIQLSRDVSVRVSCQSLGRWSPWSNIEPMLLLNTVADGMDRASQIVFGLGIILPFTFFLYVLFAIR